MVRALLVATITFGVALSYEAYEAKNAEACGVKLATKAPKVRRNTSSKNRSRILIVGKKDSSLEKQLRQKKHSVVYASSVDKVKDTKYHLVIADKKEFDAAQDRFGKRSQVMQKRSSSADTSSSVERMLARRAKSSSTKRGALLASKRRRAVETGGNAGTGRTAAETGTEGGTAARTPAAGSRDRGLLSGRRPKTDVAVEAGTDKPEPKAVEPKVEPKPDPKPKVVKAEPKPDPKPRVKPDPKPDPKPRVAKDPVEKPAKNIKWAREFRFGTNSTNLSASSRRKLQRNAQWLEQNPGASITIEGHTDTVGDENYNLDLSERRANVAKDFLLGLGIDESRINVVPKGEQEPAYQPGTSGKNRRIVLIKNN